MSNQPDKHIDGANELNEPTLMHLLLRFVRARLRNIFGEPCCSFSRRLLVDIDVTRERDELSVAGDLHRFGRRYASLNHPRNSWVGKSRRDGPGLGLGRYLREAETCACRYRGWKEGCWETSSMRGIK